MKRAETDGLFALSCGHGILAAEYRGISRRLQANAAPSAILPSACSRAKTDSFVIVNVARRFNPRSGAPIRKTRFASDGKKPWLRGSCERQPLDFARSPDPFDSAQGHPEPACGVADPELVEREPVEPVERMSVSNGRADGRFQIHSLALVATNQMLFPRRRRVRAKAPHYGLVTGVSRAGKPPFPSAVSEKPANCRLPQPALFLCRHQPASGILRSCHTGHWT